MVLVGLLPVVGCEQLVALRVLRFELGRGVEGVDGLGKISLPIIESGDRGVDERLVRLDLFRLHQRLFRFIVAPAVFVDLGQREVVGRLVGFDLDHFLNDRLGLFRLIQFLRAVGGDEILQRKLTHLLFGILFGGLLIVRNRLLNVGIVLGFAQVAGLEHVVVAVSQVEVNLGAAGVRGEGLLVLGGRGLPIGTLIQRVRVLVALLGRQRAP